jgi:thiol-disulfide isomerase/thioredoxin
MLALRPVLVGVDYDTPADQAAIDACKLETVMSADKRNIGYALRDGQGKLLRRCVIARGGRRLDQWSYFQDGFEVYREDDLDGDQRLDECRWLNSGGSRIATVVRGKISAWKQISAEEASKVLVQALVAGDVALLETVMATPAELVAAGVPKDVVEKVAAAAAKRGDQMSALQKQLVGWNDQTVWNRFDGAYPHVIPADPGSGVEKDLTLYENAMVIPGTAAVQQNAAKLAFLQVPDMIQLGATWKFIDLPRAVDPEKPIVAGGAGIRAMLFDRANNIEPRDEAMDAALKALADYDVKNAQALQTGQNDKIARYHVDRIPLLRALVKAIPSRPDDQLVYNKQVVDSLVAAVRTGLYPQGRKALDSIVGGADKLASYAALSLIDADFAMQNDEPGANFIANQKKWMAELDDFMIKFAGADEVPAVLFHLANANEFNAEEQKARSQYTKLVEKFPTTEQGKKAAGALRRLDLVGKSITVKGAGLQNESIDSSEYRSKPLLVVFWASWALPVKQDLPELRKVYEKFHPQGLQIVGVNLDNERGELDAFLKQHQMRWPQIFEAGGIESRLAVEYGIISLPTMFLVDAEGKVVHRNLRSSAEVERQLEKLGMIKQAGALLEGRK